MVITRVTEHDDVITPLLRGPPRLGLALCPAPAKAGPVHKGIALCLYEALACVLESIGIRESAVVADCFDCR